MESNLDRYRQRLLEYDEKLIFETQTGAAYPIPVIGREAALKHILGYYETKDLFRVGRSGQHQYQNADVSMHEAMKFVEKRREL